MQPIFKLKANYFLVCGGKVLGQYNRLTKKCTFKERVPRKLKKQIKKDLK